MADNSKVTQTTNGNARIAIIDPNPPGSRIIPTEDLFIYVSLRIRPKNRSVIELSDNGANVSGEEGVVINLIGTQVDSNGNEYMSTNWTNVGGNIDGKFTGDKNKETFGIKNINITYGADMLPRVNITFLDVRGASMFDGFEHTDEKGNKSNVSTYSSFFRMPYPIFELTIKGYYGKAVKYCLNMTKWSGNFNGGNFEIKAEFIGYSTSFLSDIIMDHVKYSVETEDGYTELLNVFKKNSPDINPITITELLKNIGDVDKYVADIKSNANNEGNSVGYSTLIKLNEALSKLSLIKSKVGDPIGLDDSDNINYYNLEGNYIKFNGLVQRTNIFAIRDVQLIADKGIDIYKKYRDDLINSIEEYEKTLPEDFKEYSIITKSGKQVEQFIPNVSTNQETKSLITNINKLLTTGNRKDVGYTESSEFERPPYNTFTATTVNNGFGLNTQAQYFDYFDVRKTISELYDKLTGARKDFADQVSVEINKEIDKKITFNPSIGNIFKVLCNNIEAYLNTIYNTALNAESKNSGRVSTIKGKITDTLKERIYAWPMLYKNNGDEMYLGEDIQISQNEQYFPEIRFIEKLSAAVVKENKKNIQNIPLQNKDITFPINPADVTSVYDAYNVTNFSTLQKSNMLERIVSRVFIAYDYSNFKDKINEIAKTEAAALWELTIDPISRNAISTTLNGGASSLLPLLEQSSFLIKTGSTYYTDKKIFLNKNYLNISPNITGSTTLFFDIGANNLDDITINFLNSDRGKLYYNVDNALNNNKSIIESFIPKNSSEANFNTDYYAINENITKSCWESAILDGGNTPKTEKLIEYIGKVFSVYSQKKYTLNQSVSYTGFTTANTLTSIISVDEMKGMLILATYPFKSITEFLSKLSDTAKVIDVPYSYLAWIGMHMKRQQIFQDYGVDVLNVWTNTTNNEFNILQVGGQNNYVNITSKVKNSGLLPGPFSDINFFNDSIKTKFIDVFSDWVTVIKSIGLIDVFDSNYTEDKLKVILDSIQFSVTNQELLLVSYTPKFWNLSNDIYFKIEESTLINYLNVFGQKFNSLNQSLQPTQTNNTTPRVVTDNNLKQSLYRTTKNLYDKWIGGTTNGKSYNACGGFDINSSIFSYFRFIDKDYNDISEEARINLNSITSIFNGTNVTFLEVVSRVLRDNNFLFLPLPVYIDYSNLDEVKSIFTPQTFIKQTIGSPSFVAMYNSGNSKYLDLGKSYQYTNDSYDFIDNNTSTLPSNMTSSNNNTAKSVVAFRVAFGDENQSIFKNITINQEDFTETDESLRAMSELVDRKGATQRTFVGTNLYNVYSLRSYNVNFDMMGNPMIQPLMYLQLDNIPMFHGAYSVVNVSHDITPNTMNTRVKAVRKSKFSVPLIKKSTTFLPLDLDANLKISPGITPTNALDAGDNIIDENTIKSYKNPVEGNVVITSKKGLRRGKQHQGVDIRASVNTPIISSWSGIVSINNDSDGFGLYAIIDHSNGTDKPFDDGFFYYTLYAHLNQVTVSNGSTINSGQKFALSGGEVGGANSGNSEGPHLHYEIRRSKTKTNYFSIKDDGILNPALFINGVAENNNPSHGQLKNP